MWGVDQLAESMRAKRESGWTGSPGNAMSIFKLRTRVVQRNFRRGALPLLWASDILGTNGEDSEERYTYLL